MSTPWYRPTRICQVTSGAEFGWRNGSGKWPAYYPDSTPGVCDIGPGSPTGVTFGYGAKFPAKYQQALFSCDWSYGKLYAVHLTPSGAAYEGMAEEFVTGVPLPLTDVVINPKDGAMYFAIGGRRTTSGLYRVTYTGTEPTDPVTEVRFPDEATARAHAKRLELEALHQRLSPEAIEKIWPSLSSPDRFIRFAARTALEHQDVSWWQDKAFTEPDPWALLTSLIALCRVSEHPELQTRVLGALHRLDWNALDYEQKIALVRAYQLALLRLGQVSEENRLVLIERLEPWLPTNRESLNAELLQILVALQSPQAAEKGMKLLLGAPSQEEQLNYGRSLRLLNAGWTPRLREQYFRWIQKAVGFKGGANMTLFIQYIYNDAVLGLSAEEKKSLGPLLAIKFDGTEPVVATTPRKLVKAWTMEEIEPLVKAGLMDRDFQRGRKLFGEAKCFACHRFDNQGGAVGPDLTALSGRFNVHDLLESIVDPGKVVSDQYAAVTIATVQGEVVTGRIVNLNQDNLMINTDMLDPNAQVTIKRGDIEEMKQSTASMMPKGLLDSFKKEEILDLMAYLLSRGNPEHEMFRRK
jgi:putative heme-binding domain-containing protein